METFFALLAICAGNSPVPGEIPTQRPVTRSFDVFFHLRPYKRLSKQSWGWWFETPSCLLFKITYSHYHVYLMSACNTQFDVQAGELALVITPACTQIRYLLMMQLYFWLCLKCFILPFIIQPRFYPIVKYCLMPSVLHVLSLSIVSYFLQISVITFCLTISLKDYVFCQLKFNICVRCDMAFIEPMHRENPGITYLLTRLCERYVSPLNKTWMQSNLI